MTMLGAGLSDAKRNEEALSVKEAELAMDRRLGASENDMLITQGNLANTYQKLGQLEKALQMSRDVHSGWLRLNGEEHEKTLIAAENYAIPLIRLERFEEAKMLLRKMVPVARRVLGESHELTLRMRWDYARALCQDPAATLDDLRESVTTLEEIERIARRVFGGVHPITTGIGQSLREARAALRARETPPTTV
jgi:tetratricopeptide (TPR) repeat protein